VAQISFYGAAETVTGSKYLLEANGSRALIDCGIFQGLKRLRQLNWEPLPFAAAGVQNVVLTHAHADHCGYLPRLVKQGFHGKIFCTPATRRLAELILLDAAVNQQRDAKYAHRKGFSKHKRPLPLFDKSDAKRTIQRLKTIPRGRWFAVAEPIWARFHDAGHLLGSCLVEVEIRAQAAPVRLLFSGDVGRYDGPLYHDPATPPECDYLICESTYGNREHAAVDPLDELEKTIGRCHKRGGVILISSFAVGRAQQWIYLLRLLIHEKRIAEMPIFLDSPMAINSNEIYCDFRADHDLSDGQLKGPGCVLTGPNVHLARTVAESKALNDLTGPAVIISSSGMMVGGRILYHLRRRLPDPRASIILGGFMAAGTRGRQLQDGAETLRIHGHNVPVRAAVERVTGLSGHADRSDLLRWLAPLPPPRQVFLTHGEPESAAALADTLRKDRGWNVTVPHLGDQFPLDGDLPEAPNHATEDPK
jgi:metallo-beta-lactamase family protein